MPISPGTQPAAGEAHYRRDHRQTVRPAEHRLVGIMLADFRVQHGAVGNIGRIGHDQVDPSVQFWKQAGFGDVGPHDLDRRALSVTARVLEGGVGVVESDDSCLLPQFGPLVGQSHRQSAGPGAQVDDDRPWRKSLRAGPFQQGLGFGAGYEHAGADAQLHGTECRRPQQMLQRHASRTNGHRVAVPSEKSSPGDSSKAR